MGNIERQLEVLETMPLSAEEYAALASCRRTLLFNTLGLGVVGLLGGRVMNKPSASLLTALGFSTAFGVVGSLIGLGLGVQFCVYRLLSRENSPLAQELFKLREAVTANHNENEEPF